MVANTWFIFLTLASKRTASTLGSALTNAIVFQKHGKWTKHEVITLFYFTVLNFILRSIILGTFSQLMGPTISHYCLSLHTHCKFTLQHRDWGCGETNGGWNMVQGQTKQSFRRLLQGECDCLLFCSHKIGPRNAAESAALAIQSKLTNHLRMTPQSPPFSTRP